MDYDKLQSALTAQIAEQVKILRDNNVKPGIVDLQITATASDEHEVTTCVQVRSMFAETTEGEWVEEETTSSSDTYQPIIP